MTDESSAMPTQPRVQRLVGVYDADGTLRGELAYWIGARLGRAHCSLCDVTHGIVRERGEWVERRSSLPVPFATYHRNDQPVGIGAISGPDLPAVVAETDHGLVKLLGADEIEACRASPARFVVAIDDAMAREGLAWSTPAC